MLKSKKKLYIIKCKSKSLLCALVRYILVLLASLSSSTLNQVIKKVSIIKKLKTLEIDYFICTAKH